MGQAVISPRSNVPSACCPTQPPSPKHGLDLITNSISCTPNVPSFTGMSVKVWPPLRKITKKSASTPSTVKTKVKAKNIKHFIFITIHYFYNEQIHFLFTFIDRK